MTEPSINLRVRLASGATLKVRAVLSSSYKELLQQAVAGAGVPADGASLSLNKKSPITAAASTKVGQLGLASGDLIYLLADAPGYAAAAPPPPRAAVVHVAAPENRPRSVPRAPVPAPAPAPAPPALAPSPARAATGSAAAAAAPSPREMAAAAAARRAAAVSGGGLPDAPAPAAAPSAVLQTLVGEMGFGEAAARAALARAGTLEEAVALLTAEPTAVDMPMPDAPPAAAATASTAPVGAAPAQPPPTAVVGEAPAALRAAVDAALRGSGAASAHEALVAALHVVLLQSGFAPPAAAAASQPAAALPAAWRATPGFYALEYTHARQDAAVATRAAPCVELKCVGMGDALLVHAMVTPASGAAGAPLLSWQVSASAHARAAEHAAAAPSLRQLPALMHAANLHLVQPLLSLLAAAALEPHAHGGALGLRDLCAELQMAVLSCLDAQSLGFAARACAGLAALARDDAIWARLYERDFGAKPAALAGEASAARAAYRHRVEAAREAERLRRRPPVHPSVHEPWRGEWPGAPPFLPGPYPGAPGLPVPVPGMIGGDFDLDPLALPPRNPHPFGPGGALGGYGPPLPAGPAGFLPPGAVPPGARHDPISPLVDPDGMSGVGGGGLGPFPGRGRGRGGGMLPGGMPFSGRGRGGGRGWDPDGPGFNPHFL